jgi:hypothetical protein
VHLKLVFIENLDRAKMVEFLCYVYVLNLPVCNLRACSYLKILVFACALCSLHIFVLMFLCKAGQKENKLLSCKWTVCIDICLEVEVRVS